ncbi:MAG: hypothetical protein WCT27_04010 [Patescibacteria group bacterium]|jgi:hypothetical protein
MDTVSHGAWGALIVRKTGLVGWALLTGALPDILPALYELARHPVKFIRGLINKSLADNPSRMYLTIYHWAHSLLPISFVTLLVLIFAPARSILAVPYYMHIFLDIFTHRGKWATRIFYPFSDFHFDGTDWWRHSWISIANWAVIAVVGVFIFIKH